MSVAFKEPVELRRIYSHRFGPQDVEYRRRLWVTLVGHYFQTWIPADAVVLDLGCGYGEFINAVRCGRKLAMDLNPDAVGFLEPDVKHIAQDCSENWSIPDATLDVVFTSNFFEHLPDKLALAKTLRETMRCLKPGGRLLALGPNIKYVPGEYWDFWDHFLCLTDLSLAEGMRSAGLDIVQAIDRFLPYTTINAPRFPMLFVRWYLKTPFVWRMYGKQFFVVGEKPRPNSGSTRGPWRPAIRPRESRLAPRVQG